MKLFLLLSFWFCSAGWLLAQTVTLSGKVEDEYLGTALGDVLLSLHECDSTMIQDSLPCTSFKNRNGNLMAFQYRTAFTPQENKTYLIRASKEG